MSRGESPPALPTTAVLRRIGHNLRKWCKPKACRSPVMLQPLRFPHELPTGCPRDDAAFLKPLGHVSPSVICGYSSVAKHMKLLYPTQPASSSSSILSMFFGQAPPQRAKSTTECASATSRFMSKRSLSSTEMLGSGISTIVVMPPDAADFDAQSQSSRIVVRAWVTQMCVRVNHTRQNHLSCRLNNFTAVCVNRAVRDLCDLSVLNQQIPLNHLIFQNNIAILNQRFLHMLALPPRFLYLADFSA